MAANGKKEAQNCKYFMVAREEERGCWSMKVHATAESRGANWTFLVVFLEYKWCNRSSVKNLYPIVSYRWKNAVVGMISICRFLQKEKIAIGNWNSTIFKYPQIVCVFVDLVGFCNVVTAIFPHLIPKT